MLASTDRLDDTLMIGQMQGKFQLVLFTNTGHNLHEDCAERVAESIMAFVHRNKPAVIKRFVIPLKPSDHATSPL